MDDHDRSERHDDKSAKPPAKPIDNQVLAAMLRESASIVERGEFEPILYTALQDFRVYYKLHYPTKKNKSRSRSRSLTREKEKKISNSPSNANELSKEASVQASKAPETTLSNTIDESVQADTAQNPIVVEESTEATAPVTLDVMSTLEKHLDSMTPTGITAQEVFEPEPKVEPHIPHIAGIVTAIPLTNSIVGHPKLTEDHHSPAGSIQKASVNTLLGKLKFPMKIGVTLPNPAFVAASKKNAERAKEDLEAFSGPLAQQAESSRRRKTGDDGATGKWCEVHFAMNCACKERTHSTVNSSSEPLSHSLGGERAQFQAGQRDDEKHDLMTQTAQTSFVATGSTGTTTVPVTHGQATSAVDSPEASPSPAATETAAAAKEVYSNPFQNIQEGGGQTMTQQPVAPLKPDFQRPSNANSTLIANGWIEQQRRSKMRFVWKEVLASLVQGRKPGEHTTLWIQREIFNPVTHKKELEALHQIPVKLVESCTFLDYSTDNRFTLKLYNATEEFVFRCRTDSAAANWVQVLKKHHQISRGGATFEEEKKGPENSSSSSKMTVNELRAICHGAGINTAGMERAQLEAAAEEVTRRGTYFAPPPGAPRPIPIPQTTTPQQNPTPPANAQHLPPEVSQASGSAKLSVSELRAICHGAGINTVGMERSQLEQAAEEVRNRGTYFPPPNTHAPPPPTVSAAPPPQPAPHVPAVGRNAHVPPPAPTSHVPPAPQASATQERLSINELRAVCHGAGINTVGMERQQLERAADEVRKRGTYFDRPSPTPSANTARPPSTSVPEDAQREAARRRDEEEKNRLKMEDEHRRRMAEQEHQRRVAEQQAAEQHRRYAEQQAAWQKQQQEEENRRRLAEQQAAEQRRRHEEAVRQQQQWQQQQWQKQQQWNQQYQQQQQQQQPPKQWPPNQAPPPQNPQWQQQQQQRPQQPPPQQQRPQSNQQQQQQPHHSAASEKYAKMANQTDEEGQAMITRIKHEILIHWALQPPQLQMLRPIDVLVTTIHKVFPPALGVPAHDYFSKFKPVSVTDVSDNGTPDEEGLKKAVRKIRFFLHPDKLPKDLNPEQAFMVKMLWDVTSDAWDEFEKRKSDLDWIK